MNRLRERALALGASAAEILAADRLSSEDDLAAFCTSCEGYGQTANCPPQVMTPAQFRERLRGVRAGAGVPDRCAGAGADDG